MMVLDSEVERFANSIVRDMPNEYKREIESSKSDTQLGGVSDDAHLWVTRQISGGNRQKLDRAAARFSQIRFDSDMTGIILAAIWANIHGEEFEVSDHLKRLERFWEEAEAPKILKDPKTGGEIQWFWKLSTNARPSGKIHVGLNMESRHFVCYERGIGFYRPEGILVERIRSEIVQDEAMSSGLVGRSFLEKVDESFEE